MAHDHRRRKDLLVHDVFCDILLRLPDAAEHRAADPFRSLARATLGTFGRMHGIELETFDRQARLRRRRSHAAVPGRRQNPPAPQTRFRPDALHVFGLLHSRIRLTPR